jgi:hypothetical protein
MHSEVSALAGTLKDEAFLTRARRPELWGSPLPAFASPMRASRKTTRCRTAAHPIDRISETLRGMMQWIMRNVLVDKTRS